MEFFCMNCETFFNPEEQEIYHEEGNFTDGYYSEGMDAVDCPNCGSFFNLAFMKSHIEVAKRARELERKEEE